MVELVDLIKPLAKPGSQAGLRWLLLGALAMAALGILVPVWRAYAVGLALILIAVTWLRLPHFTKWRSSKEGLANLSPVTTVGAAVMVQENAQSVAPFIKNNLVSETAIPDWDDLSHSLFEASPVGMVCLDRDGIVVAANGKFCELISHSDGTLAGRNFLDWIVADEREIIRVALATAALAVLNLGTSETTSPNMANSAPRPLEANLSTQPKRVVQLHIGWLPRPFGNVASSGIQAELIVHLVDVTPMKVLENQMLQARKMQAVGQLAGGIAHDFNNLLQAMMGFCDLLLLRHRAGDQSFADIMQIKQNANRAASLVRQLLAFSRQQTLRPKVLDITDTLTELSHLLRRLIGQTVSLKLYHGRDLGLVKVDQGQFEQVIINLAVNARDAMAEMIEGGTLTIRTCNFLVAQPTVFAHETMPVGDYVRIDVEDSGTGIPDEVMAHIFEPFFTTKPVGSGTGLGLSTVYGIVRQTGGFVSVDSKIGKGTIFSIYLPRHSGAMPAEDQPGDDYDRNVGDTTGTGTILLVEDEDPVRLFTARALRNKGYKIFEAKSGEAALELLDTLDEPIQLMITDAVMPVIDGPTLIKLVRQRIPDIRVICISGHTDETLRRRITSDGEVLFLPKPFSLKQLTLRVKEKFNTLNE